MGNLQKSGNDAVSPVIGVMLMLVVTIIIAAVVSAYSGGLTKTEEKAPTASIECHITNDGTWGGSGFDLIVTSVSAPIPTKNLKLVTSWKASDGTTNGTIITGPNLTAGNTHYGTSTYHSPLGFGPGVNRSVLSGTYYPDQMYGNYSLMAGTRLHNSPYGWNSAYGGYGVDPSTRYQYTDGSTYVYATSMDGMQAILGPDWWHLKPGDVVSVKLIYVPSGKEIYDQKISVEG